MAKFKFKKSKTRKAAIAALCAVAVTCTSLAAACQPNDSSTTDDDTSRPEDKSTLTNGSFEFFNVPDDAVYLIKNVQDWSRSGDSSGTMSGILDTSVKNWEAITASDLADKLDTNNDLLTTDDKHVDYNGMKSGDIPYKEPYVAKLDKDAVKDDKIISKNDLSYAEFLGIKEVDGKYTYGEGDDAVEVYFDEETGDFYFEYDENSGEYLHSVRYEVIANPETHYGSYNEKDGKHYLGDHEIYVDEDGYYYKDEDHEYSEGNVLMIHNYPTDTKYNGIQQYYSSSTITLESRTAAKISVWVKTSNLKFDKGYSLLEEQDRGAFIEVVQTVGGTTIDEFTIKAINTEKILKDNSDLDTNNGWLQYNIYVNACDFAQCTVQLRLGLGKSNGETCTGYAFFDDVEVVKERKIENTGYSDVSAEILEKGTYCNLSDEGEDKIFYADKAVKGDPDDRHSKDFNYYIDLASESGTDGYTTFDLEGNITAGLTTEKEDKITYASAKTYEGKTNLRLGTIGATDYSIYKNSVARPTDKDFLGLFTANESFTDSHVADKYIKGLNDALFGDKSFEKLPTHDATSKMLVTFSAWGAAYTSTINNPDVFTLNAGEQMILSFWVKTSDITNQNPATVYIYDIEDKDKEHAQELNIKTTDITTDIDDEKDIYNGWVQCFFFIQNNTKDDNKKFQIDFCFGNTSIISATSYDPGWIALANMQTLKITEEVYNLTATANFTKKFQFSTDDKEKTNKKFADALGTYDITEEIALPNGYNGVNGASSSVSDADYSHYYDIWNTNRTAGLINRDNFFDDDGNPTDWNNFLKTYFTSASQSAANWNEVFGKDCYQPLIIVNNLRKYADNAHANEDTYNNGNYYLLVDDEYVGDFVEDYAGRRYRKVTEDDEFDEEETYYTFKEVVNYGFVGGNKTISSNATEVITVKVMVTEGATAYIYLVDPTTREVMSYSVPGYTFWYDDEGNVLDEEFDEDWDRKDRDSHTVYDKQDNGLYKDKDGNYVANLHNLKKIYQKEKLDTYYYKDGDTVKEYRGTKCVDGVDYFVDEACETPAPHRLCNSDDQPIYQYKDGAYYYIVSGKVSSIKVGNFDAKYARYNYDQNSEKGESLADTEYCIEVGDTHGKWVTVNFVVKAGNKSKSYRLELWSGKRDETGVTDQTDVKGAVAFDYSAYTVSNYDSILRTDDASYEKSIIREYQELLAGHEDEFELDFTIKDYEELAEKYLSENAKYTELKNSYIAHYYTYSLYDTAEFIPFNQEVAEDGETDYDYTAPNSESLAYFSNVTKDSDGNITSYNTFIDYSAVEKEINKTNAPSDSDSDNSTDDNSTAGEFWLQLASILLVVVLLFVLLVLVARIIIKRVRRKLNLKKQSKNVYRQRKRYLRKLHIEEEETEEIDNPALQNSEATDTPVEEVKEEVPAEEAPAEAPVEETPAEPAEAPVEEVKEEVPAETTPVEEAPAEAPVETPAETPSDNSENKPE